MKNLIRFALGLFAVGSISVGQAATSLPRSAPEAQGVSSAAMLDFINALDTQIEAMHSIMVVRHGYVIAEGWWTPYDAEHNHVLYSLSKSFTSTAVGLAIAEGKLDLFDPVLKFYPEDAPEDPGANLKSMRIRDLLTMSTGHQDEPSAAPDVVSPKSFYAQPVPHKPGTHFKYNTAATFMLSAIVQKVTGETVLDYLQPRLFEPLGIEHPVWDKNFQGICLGGYGLRVRTEDIAKFGQLYLQKGNWQGKQLLPASWVELATSRMMSNGSNPQSDWDQGYGFQFWRCRHNAYRGDGAFGQYCIVMPDQNTVVAITSGVGDMQKTLKVVWDKLLPALGNTALAANASGDQALQEKLAGLQTRTAEGSATPSSAKKFLGQKFTFPANDQKLESVELTASGDGKELTLNVAIAGQKVSIPCGHETWLKARGPYLGGALAQFPDEPLAGSFGWPSDNTCKIKVVAYETPFNTVLTLKFDGDQVAFDAEANVAFGPRKKPELIGKRD
ncbi:serine hydrolase [bacterium]|nr:serine hydrolase [bacterium]